MTRFFSGPLPDHPRNLLRRLGYGEQQNREGQVSYNRLFTHAPFPKYHAYVEAKNGGLQVNLHVDQKGASHDGAHAHSGEYEGELVARELERLAGAIASLQRAAFAGREENPPDLPTKKGFWGNLFS